MKTTFVNRVLLLGLCLALLIPAFAVAKSETITIKFANWASAETVTRQNIEKVIAAFEAEHPGVKIENIAVPFGQMRQQLITMTAGGNPPDVAQVCGNWPFELSAMGALEDLNNYITAEEKADFWQGAGIEAGTADGKLVALPWGINLFGFWYNKDLMKQAGLDPENPPATWDELLVAFDKANKAFEGTDIDIFELFTAKAEYGVVHNWSFFWAYGGFPLEDGTNFNTPEMTAYFAWMQKMIKEGYTTGGFKLREFREEFAKDRLLFAFDGPYMKGTVQSLNPEITDEIFYDKYGVTVIPAGKSGESMTAVDIHQLSMSRQSKNKEMAWEFMRFLTSSNVGLEEYLYKLGSIPPRQSSVNETHAHLWNDSITKAYVEEVIPSARPIPYGPQWGSAAQFIISGIQAVTLGNSSPEEVVRDLDKSLKTIYGK